MPLDLRPGDLLAFAGRSAGSRCINLGTWGWPLPWPASWHGITHVGIVAAPHPREPVLLFESLARSPGMPCVIQGLECTGVQAHRPTARVAQELARGTPVWHYPLARRLRFASQIALSHVAMAAVGTPYDWRGAWDARALPIGRLKGWLLGDNGIHELFCSEFAAACWIRCGRLLSSHASRWAPNQLCRRAVRARITRRPVRLTEADL